MARRRSKSLRRKSSRRSKSSRRRTTRKSMRGGGVKEDALAVLKKHNYSGNSALTQLALEMINGRNKKTNPMTLDGITFKATSPGGGYFIGFYAKKEAANDSTYELLEQLYVER